MELLKVKVSWTLFIGIFPGPRTPMKNNLQEEPMHIKKKKKECLSLRTRGKEKSKINFKIKGSVQNYKRRI